MGGAVSSSASERVIESTARNISHILNRCTTNATASQVVDISNVAGDVRLANLNLKQQQVLNVDCLTTKRNIHAMTEALKENISTQVNNESVMSFMANSQSTISNKLEMLTGSETQDNLSNILSTSVLNSQSLNIDQVQGNVILGNVTMIQKSRIVVEALIDATGMASILKELDVYEENASKNRETTVFAEILNGISNVFQSTFGIWIILGVFAFVVILKKLGMI